MIAKGKLSLKLTLIIVVLSVLGIEVLQLIFKRGYFELDDIFHNTLGSCLGFVCYKLKIRSKQRRNE